MVAHTTLSLPPGYVTPAWQLQSLVTASIGVGHVTVSLAEPMTAAKPT